MKKTDYRSAARTLLQTIVKRRLVGGGVVGILQEGQQEIFSIGAPGKELPTDGIFELGSVSKVFVGMLLSKLQTEHRLSLDESILRFLPAGVCAQAPARPIRLIDLATHTSGLPLHPDNVGRMQRSIDDPWAGYTHEDLHRFLSHTSLERPETASFIYSNVDYFVLADAMRMATGIPFPQLLMQEILEPLKMRTTFLDVPPWKEVLPGHTGVGRPAPHWVSPVFKNCGGGVCSTAEDCLRLLDLCLAPTAPWRKVVETMLAPRVETGKRAVWSQAALPWFIDTEDGWYWHNGVTGGHSAYLAFNPTERLGLVVLTDRYAIELTTDFARRMQRVMQGKPAEVMTGFYDLRRAMANQVVLEFVHLPIWLRSGLSAAVAGSLLAKMLPRFASFTLLPPALRSSLLVAVAMLFTAGGLALFRLSRRLSQQGGRYAVLDVVASIFAVCLFFWLLAISSVQLTVLSSVLFAVACGVCASALFRFQAKTPGPRGNTASAAHPPASHSRETL